METTIRLKPGELNMDILDMVKVLIAKKGFTDISISLTNDKLPARLRKANPADVRAKIENALSQINAGDVENLISFSAEELELFSKSLVK